MKVTVLWLGIRSSGSQLRRCRYIHLHGNTKNSVFSIGQKPPDPNKMPDSLVSAEAQRLFSWWAGRERILVITGAGISTESGIPDYRGYTGSYFAGHKPMVHDQFMNSSYQRQRYWGRGLAGWRYFDSRRPSKGHHALVSLSRIGKIGVTLEDCESFYEDQDDFLFGNGQRKVSIVTQNVDGLHVKAGMDHVVELHGRIGVLKCMSCFSSIDRRTYHEKLEKLNAEWMLQMSIMAKDAEYRADGDASVSASFEKLVVPQCPECSRGFFKPDVVLFGDSVPRHRVRLVEEAINACDGLLIIGSSLAVHSANRHVRAANKRGVDIAILNVGKTRPEAEGLPVLKIEAPAGKVLEQVVELFGDTRD